MVLKRAQEGPVLTLTLNDYATRNSISEAMMHDMRGALEAAASDHSIHVIVFAAEGAVYSAGHNLKELTAHRADKDSGAAYFAKTFADCSHLMTMIANHRCVTIAQVGGLASAAGCQLVASCDFAIANEHAKFCTPGVNIGLFCSTPMVALSRAVSPRHAREMLLTGNIYDAAHALRIGLINEIVTTEKLASHVAEMAARISGKSQQAIEFGKPAIAAQSQLGLTEAYQDCSALMVKNFLAPSAREGVGAVLEKRKPVWPQ